MTSEVEALKTNEFLRRRKLRLQQVREQSKDIAKKIRQRAKVETLRQVVDLDTKKQKEYFDRQEKLVKRLEVLYARGLNNIGASHQSASELRQDDVVKKDLSKVRGREATAELRKKRQEKLDQHKKLLDRKIQARETANVISREKSSAVVNKLNKAPSKSSDEISQRGPGAPEIAITCTPDVNLNEEESEAVTKNDMATQWDGEAVPKEWQPVVPALVLPKDDQVSSNQDELVSKSDKSKQIDLFAVSKEMPTDLCSHPVPVSGRRDTVRPSLTLVSEYLQTRKLRLRETDPPSTKKKSDDISSLKQTILRTRSAKPEGISYDVCRVLDEQVIPVPSWHAEGKCEFCSNKLINNKSVSHTKKFTSVTNSQINRIFSSIRPLKQCGGGPSPVLRSTSPFRRNKMCLRFSKAATGSDNLKPDYVLSKKSSITMYNHNTRDSRELPCSDEQLVVRDLLTEEDAYARALEEASLIHEHKDHQKKVQDMRSKVAVTKQTVEKEYKETINFLNSLPKDKGNKVRKTAYMDDIRQQMQNEKRQHKLEQEYRKIEKECRRHHSCTKKSNKKSRSPPNQDAQDDFDSRDFQYSWMPVPESDGNLAIHTIPNTVKEGKSGNTVQFSKVDSYHEYRSRHKHTPPTKDTASPDKHPYKTRPRTVVVDKNASESTDDSSITSDTSSIENLRLEKKSRQDPKVDEDTSDAERIIIYKILDTKGNKQSKKKNKLLSDIAKSLTSIEKVQKSVIEDHHGETSKKQHKGKSVHNTTPDNTISFEHINEGVYKIAEEKADNMTSMCTPNDRLEKPPITRDKKQYQYGNLNSDNNRGSVTEWECGHIPQAQRSAKSCHCSTTCKENDNSSPLEVKKTASASKQLPTPSSSSSSFKTAKNERLRNTTPPGGDYIKLVDEVGQETGKFFLSDTGFLKDNAYEVVIQLRKKNGSKDEGKSQESVFPEQSKESTGETKSCEKGNTEIVETVHLLTPESGSNLRQDLEPDNVFTLSNGSGKRSGRTSPCSFHEPGTDVESRTVDQHKDQSDTIHETHKKITHQQKNLCDKETTTAIQNDYQIPTSSFDPPSRPATTTYTQTTNSPIHRPVYFHMSSSTSTAYMSPPDMILPNFLRRDSGMTDYEISELKNIDSMRESVNNGRIYKKCRHARKTVSKVHIHTMGCKKQQSTPPNTVRTSLNSVDNLEPHKVCKNLRPDKKCKCHYCAVTAKDHVRKRGPKTISRPLDSIRSSQNFNLITGVKGVKEKHQTTSSAYSRKSREASLTPVVKNYINKLLALNKQGLKALEVAEQECSSVGTPGSSIINVPCNIDERKTSLGNKISLENIKHLFIRQIMEEHLSNQLKLPTIPPTLLTASKKYLPRKPHRKPVHKIKSLNISKHLLNKRKIEKPASKNHVSISTTTDDYNKTVASSNASRSRPRSSPPSRQGQPAKSSSTYKQYNSAETTPRKKVKKIDAQKNKNVKKTDITPHLQKQYMPKRSVKTDTSPEPESTKESHEFYKNKPDIPNSMSTQTSQNIDSDFMKLAEDKLHNMEKIADLTEKCTKRLSNLAKVLEEVRKNKSFVYSQISTSDSTDSHSEQRPDKVVKTPVPIDLGDVPNTFEIKSPEPIPEKEYTSIAGKENAPTEFISFLTDIPKPATYKMSEHNITNPAPLNVTNLLRPIPVSHVNADPYTTEIMKCRQKPPPALSRIHLKHGQEDIVPHELSTVIEVDSPMSIKNKTHSSRRYDPNTSIRSSNEESKNNKNSEASKIKEVIANPDLLQSNLEQPKQPNITATESSNDSKFQMIDLKHFNEIMLEPFISLHEYAKKYNIEAHDEMSNFEELQRDDAINDDISSLHSEGSLPDVIAELLKRNVITEPFKFDTASNVNSTSISSESTLSMLALSKARQGKKKGNVVFRNKENIGETSDTLSISSNPDLENAFKKLGMGWASSTLKRTKERLALSSSSNTSSSSISQLKIKNFHQDIPALVTDSVSSVMLSKKGVELKKIDNNAKDAKQQTSFPKSMTVNDFLANELANKITFTTNKTDNETEEEFVSLFETKLPEGMHQQTQICDANSNDSEPSGINRARTSTPVQIFKSMTYHSSSGSNLSNGLFSNVDDLSSVKMTSHSMKNHSTSDKDELTIPNFSLKMKKGNDSGKSD